MSKEQKQRLEELREKFGKVKKPYITKKEIAELVELEALAREVKAV